MIFALIVALIAGGGIAFLTVYHWQKGKKARAQYDASYLPLIGAQYDMRWAAAFDVNLARLGSAASCAVECLILKGPWTREQLAASLRGLRIFVRVVEKWIDPWGRVVAGLAWPAEGDVEVGCDFRALCHELAEVAYARIEKQEDWQAREWYGRAQVEAAVAEYVTRLPHT